MLTQFAELGPSPAGRAGDLSPQERGEVLKACLQSDTRRLASQTRGPQQPRPAPAGRGRRRPALPAVAAGEGHATQLKGRKDWTQLPPVTRRGPARRGRRSRPGNGRPPRGKVPSGRPPPAPRAGRGGACGSESD